MPLDKTTIDACLNLLRTHWPTVDELPDGVYNLTLNRIQKVLEQEGLQAITPARIEGWREIAEGYLVPFNEASIPTVVPPESPKGSAADSAAS